MQRDPLGVKVRGWGGLCATIFGTLRTSRDERDDNQPGQLGPVHLKIWWRTNCGAISSFKTKNKGARVDATKRTQNETNCSNHC